VIFSNELCSTFTATSSRTLLSDHANINIPGIQNDVESINCFQHHVMKYCNCLPEKGSESVSDVRMESLKRKRKKLEGTCIYAASNLSDKYENRVLRQSLFL
jgi:hypothetical protein